MDLWEGGCLWFLSTQPNELQTELSTEVLTQFQYFKTQLRRKFALCMVNSCYRGNLPVTLARFSFQACQLECNYRRGGDLIPKNDGNRDNIWWKTAAMILEYNYSHCCYWFKKKKRAVAKGRMEKKMSNSICSVVFNGERSSDELKYRSFRAVLMFYLENRKIIVPLFFPIACVKMLAYTGLF